MTNLQRSPRKKKVLQSCHWAAKRRRRKASDEDGRSHVSLSISLAELGREKANAVRRDDHVCRVTAERRPLRRTPRRRHGEEEGAAEKSKSRCNSSKTSNNDATIHDGRRRREGGGFVEEKHDTDGREQGDSPPRPPQGRDRRKGRAKNHNRPECSTRFEEEAEKVRHDTLSTRCRGSCRERRRTEKHSQAASYVELSILSSRI